MGGESWSPLSSASRSGALAYHAINLVALLLGLWFWMHVVRQWRKCIRVCTPVIRSYVYLTIADGVVLFTYLCVSFEGLARRGVLGT